MPKGDAFKAFTNKMLWNSGLFWWLQVLGPVTFVGQLVSVYWGVGGQSQQNTTYQGRGMGIRNASKE